MVTLATAGYEQSIRLWEANSGKSRELAIADKHVNRLCISPDGQHIAAACHSGARVFSIGRPDQKDPILRLEGHKGNVTAIGYQKHGRFLYTGGEDGTLRVWEPEHGKLIRTLEVGSCVNGVALHPNQVDLISASNDGFVRVWDLQTSQCIAEMIPEEDEPLCSVDIASDASMLCAATRTGNAYFWRVGTATPGPGTPAAQALAAGDAQDGQAAGEGETAETTGKASAAPVAAAAAGGGEAGLSGGSAVAEYIPERQLLAHREYILCCKFSPDTRLLATCSSDQRVKLWNTRDFSLATRLTGHERWVWDCTFSSDSMYLVSASTDGQAKLWETATGKCVQTYSTPGRPKPITCVALADKPPTADQRPPERGSPGAAPSGTGFGSHGSDRRRGRR